MKWFSLVYQGDVHPSTDEKLLPGEEYAQLCTAKEIIDKAQEDVAQLFVETRKECEKLREEAKQAGFQEGLESFNVHILHMDQELKKLRHTLQQMVLPLALKAAKKIVGRELETFPETIVDIVLQAMAPITESRKVIIYVNKADKEHLEKEKNRIKEILPQIETLSIQEKNDISPGGCIIQTESGMINATIENQWKALERAFEKYSSTFNG